MKLRIRRDYLGGLFFRHSSTWETDGLIKDSLADSASSNGTVPVMALRILSHG
jgi:hypothetical protein